MPDLPRSPRHTGAMYRVEAAAPTNLPARLTTFVGRAREQAEVLHLLRAARLVTITGPGGMGKTRLALESAASLLPEYRDGVWLVELSPLPSPGLLLQAVSQAVGLRDEYNQPRMESLLEFLGGKRLLLVLDNCEHMVDDVAALVEHMLTACPQLSVLATSREALRIPGEMVYNLPPLSVPDPAFVDGSRGLSQYESVQLFCARAGEVLPGFTLDEDDAPALARMCQRLEGLPLAIELAAARLRVLSVRQISDRLERDFNLLTAASRTAVPRQQTLKAAFDWSYNLLSAEERLLFRWLSPMPGSWPLEAAETIARSAGLQPNAVLDLLTQLVDKSLVLRLNQPGESARYRVMSTIRQYGLEKLGETGEREPAGRAFLEYSIRLADEAARGLWSRDVVAWLDRLDLELDNLRFAMEWTISHGLAEPALRIAAGLLEFWDLHTLFVEGAGWLERALALPGAQDPALAGLRARALLALGVLVMRRHDLALGTEWINQALALAETLGDTHTLGMARMWLARMHTTRRDYPAAAHFFQLALADLRASGDEWNALTIEHYLAARPLVQHNEPRAQRELLEASLARARQTGHLVVLADALIGLGDLELHAGNYDHAYDHINEAITIYHRLGNDVWVAESVVHLGVVQRMRGDLQQALQFLFVGLHMLLKANVRKINISYALVQVAEIASLCGAYELAAELTGCAEDLVIQAGAARLDLISDSYEAFINALREQVSAPELVEAAARGAALGQVKLVEIAEPLLMACLASHAQAAEPAPQSPAEAFGLTAREQEVLALVATGLTDQQVAERLFLSPRTVGKHLQSIYRKLDVTSRSAATRFALDHGLAGDLRSST